MNLDKIIDGGRAFFHQYTLLSVVIVLGLLVCLCRNPKEFFKLTAVLSVLGLAIYFLAQLGQPLFTGVNQKNNLIHKTRNAAGE